MIKSKMKLITLVLATILRLIKKTVQTSEMKGIRERIRSQDIHMSSLKL